MTFEIKFSPEGEDTFDAVVLQLRARWGESYVRKFESRLLSALKTIQTSPYIYPLVDDSENIRKCVVHKNCSMLYMVTANVILIVCFWDNRQEPMSFV